MRNQQSLVTLLSFRPPDRKDASDEHVSLVKCEQRKSSHDISVSFVGRGPTSGSGPFVQQIKRLTSRGLSVHLCFSLSLSCISSFSIPLFFLSVGLSLSQTSSHSMMSLSLPFYLCSFSVSVCFFCLRLMKICLVIIETSSHT